MGIDGFKITPPKLEERESDTLRKAVEMQVMHRETFDEAWERVLTMKNTPTVTEKLLNVREAMINGIISRSPDKVNKKFSKSEALEYAKDLEDMETERFLREMVEETPDNYHLINTAKSLNRVVEVLSKEKEIVFDVETTGVDIQTDYIVGHVLTAVEQDLHFYIPTKHDVVTYQLPHDIVTEALRPIYENESIDKVAHNAKFDINMLAKDGIEVNGFVWDTQEAMKLLNENERTYALKPLVEKYLKIPSMTYGQLFGQRGFHTVDLETSLAYAAKDGEITYKLKEFQVEHMKSMPSLYKYCVEVEMPLVSIVAKMEQVGYTLDMEFAKEYGERLKTDIDRLYSEVQEELLKPINNKRKQDFSNPNISVGDKVLFNNQYIERESQVVNINSSNIVIKSVTDEHFPTETGTIKAEPDNITLIEKKPLELATEINLNSPAQLKEAIEAYIGRPINNTNAKDTLKPLAKEYEVIEKLLSYREMQKLYSTYISNLPELVNEDTGRLYTNFNQNGAKTGRFSSGGGGTFNMQNIPVEARSLFVAPDGYYIVGADFSAQEVRIIASESQEDVLLEAFADDKDPYATLASRFFNKPYEECYKNPDGSDTEERKMMKVVLLSSMYGASKYGLAQSLDISVDKAEEFRKNFFRTYPKIDRFIKDTQAFVSRTGFVWIGDEERKRRLPEARDRNPLKEYDRRRALRQAPNACIQGRASLQTKRTMIELDKECRKRGWILYFTIHDEIAVLMPKGFTKEDTDRFEEIMTQTYLLDGVENKADVEIQSVWGEVTKVQEWFEEESA